MDCSKCYKYRGKERENDALRHELGLMEKENAALREALAEFVNDGCVLTARADPYPNSFVAGGGGAGGGAWSGAQQAAFGMAQQLQQNTMAQQQALAQQNQIMGQHQQALAQQAAGPLTAVQAKAARNALVYGVGVTHVNANQLFGGGGAGGAGGNGGNGNSVSARAWCEKHQRWADECGVRSVGDASKSVIAAIKRAMGMDVTA